MSKRDTTLDVMEFIELTGKAEGGYARWEAAGMLLLFSYIALVEGVIRMVLNANPAGMDGQDLSLTAHGIGQIPPIALLVSAVGEVVFGLFGVLVAFYFLAFRKFNAMVTKIFISVQFLLGWFVFLTFVVADPINVAVHATEGQDTLSLSQRRFALIVGQLFGSVAFCYALQGGQFIHGIRFLNLNEEGSIPVKKDRIRSYIWNGNLILAGFSTICIGALLHANPIEELFIPFPPHLVWYPTMSLVTGIVMSCYGILGLLATSSESLASWMVNSFPVVLLLMLGNFSFTQGKLLGVDVPLLGAAQLVGLVFCVTILPVYFTYKVHHPDE